MKGDPVLTVTGPQLTLLVKAFGWDAVVEMAPLIGWREVADCGVRTLSGYATPEEEAAMAAIHGWRYGYPSCCVEAFCDDLEHGRLPGVRRGSVALDRPSWADPAQLAVYVPCPSCCEAMGREYIP